MPIPMLFAFKLRFSSPHLRLTVNYHGMQCILKFILGAKKFNTMFSVRFFSRFYCHIGHHVNAKWSTNSLIYITIWVFIDFRKSNEFKSICNIA